MFLVFFLNCRAERNIIFIFSGNKDMEADDDGEEEEEAMDPFMHHMYVVCSTSET